MSPTYPSLLVIPHPLVLPNIGLFQLGRFPVVVSTKPLIMRASKLLKSQFQLNEFVNAYLKQNKCQRIIVYELQQSGFNGTQNIQVVDTKLSMKGIQEAYDELVNYKRTTPQFYVPTLPAIDAKSDPESAAD